MIMAGVVVPVPFGWSVAGGIISPIMKMVRNEVPGYGAGLIQSMATGWPGLVPVILLALASASITMRLHRKYHRPRATLWWWFVFLLGPAGLLAYWLGHHRAVLETCASCGATVPRDRDGCAACEERFPAPTLLGTEVFA